MKNWKFESWKIGKWYHKRTLEFFCWLKPWIIAWIWLQITKYFGINFLLFDDVYCLISTYNRLFFHFPVLRIQLLWWALSSALATLPARPTAYSWSSDSCPFVVYSHCQTKLLWWKSPCVFLVGFCTGKQQDVHRNWLKYENTLLQIWLKYIFSS